MGAPDDLDPRDRDRIGALAEGFRRLTDRLDRRYQKVARGLRITTAITLVTLSALVVLERRRATDQTRARLDAALYRVCQREAVDRAYAHSFTPRRELVKIERSLPILYCEPNTRGEPARALTSAAQRDFVRRFVAGRLTLREQGICRAHLPERRGQAAC